jgi:hypothetical protein
MNIKLIKHDLARSNTDVVRQAEEARCKWRGNSIALLSRYNNNNNNNNNKSSYGCRMDNSYIPVNYSNKAICWK